MYVGAVLEWCCGPPGTEFSPFDLKPSDDTAPISKTKHKNMQHIHATKWLFHTKWHDRLLVVHSGHTNTAGAHQK